MPFVQLIDIEVNFGLFGKSDPNCIRGYPKAVMRHSDWAARDVRGFVLVSRRR